jgi:hypothetical protein
LLGLACVNDDRPTGLYSQLELTSEERLLLLGCGEVVVKIESGLTNGNYSIQTVRLVPSAMVQVRQSAEIVGGCLGRVVGMNAGDEKDARPSTHEFQCSARIKDVLGDRDDAVRSSLTRALEYLVDLWREILVREMAMRVDQHPNLICAGANW